MRDPVGNRSTSTPTARRLLTHRRSNANPHVVIALTTHDGAQFVEEQIASIQQQTYWNWQILVRDDASSDATPQIVGRLANADSRITLLDEQPRHLGAVASFSRVMQQALEAGADYVLLADQDDVWSAHKIAMQLEFAQYLDRESAVQQPLLVHSDLSVVSADLRPIHPSFIRYERLPLAPNNPLQTLLVQNYVTGCTILVNRPLLEIALPIPADVPMHDWWLAICAAATGSIHFLENPTVLYRQHAGNQIGSHSPVRHMLRLLGEGRRRIREHRAHLRAAVLQAKSLIERLEDRGLDGDLQLPREFCAAFDAKRGTVSRIARLHKLGILRRPALKQLALLAQCALGSPTF